MAISTHKQTQLLNKYLALYKKNSNSRVFAPLAETYRKLGQFEKAKSTLEKGLKKHPDYVLAYIVLGNLYSDLGKFEDAFKTLQPLVRKNVDNISLQKLFSDVCIKLGEYKVALEVNKYLLLLNPRDKLLSSLVLDLENRCESEVILEEYSEDLDGDDVDSWVQKSFIQESVNQSSETLEEEADDWEVESKPKLEDFKNSILNNDIEVKEHSLDDEFYYEEYDNEDESDDNSEDLDPIITHTLIDLYLSQGFKEKAISVLEGILVNHPEDKATLIKLNEIKLSTKVESSSEDHVSLEDKVENLQSKELKQLHNKFTTFLALVRNESKKYHEKNINH